MDKSIEALILTEIQAIRAEQSEIKEDVAKLYTKVGVVAERVENMSVGWHNEADHLMQKILDNKQAMDEKLEEYRKRNCPTYQEAMQDFFKSPVTKVFLIFFVALCFGLILALSKGMELLKKLGVDVSTLPK